MSARGRVKRWANLASEAAGALLLVLALFWLFIMFLYALFPSGTPLKELMENRSGPLPARDAAGRLPEAALKALLRDVRFRRGDSVAWGGASEGMLLYSHDAVQTFDHSEATIAFAPGDLLLLGSNSLVVVTRLNQNIDTGYRSYHVQVEGDLAGSISGSRKVRVELATAGHLARIVPGPARFRVTPNGDNCASLAVYAGEARVAGEAGGLRVPAYHGVTLRKGVGAGPAVPLPKAPRLDDEKLLYKYRLLPPKVRFTWSGGAGEYRFQLSRDASFKNPVLDRKCAAPEMVAGTLDAGSYFWRVSRIEQGMEGAFSRVGRCQLLQMLKAPELTVGFPPESVEAGAYRLTGRSDPGTRVLVNGVEAAQGALGEFVHELLLRPGVNLIRVEALDPAGNASYDSRVVYGKKGPDSGGNQRQEEGGDAKQIEIPAQVQDAALPASGGVGSLEPDHLHHGEPVPDR